MSDEGYGVILQTQAVEVSAERASGHKEGFEAGMLLQKIITLNLLESLEADVELIEKVKKHFNL